MVGEEPGEVPEESRVQPAQENQMREPESKVLVQRRKAGREERLWEQDTAARCDLGVFTCSHPVAKLPSVFCEKTHNP